MQLSFFRKKKIYLRASNEKYIDITTGEILSELPTFRVTVIYDTRGRTYRESRVKPADKYKYRLKNGKWISTKEANTSYLAAVIQDKYGKAVVLTIGKTLAYCILGQQRELIQAKSKEELEEKVEHFYQGISYKRKSFSEAYSEVFREEDHTKLLVAGIVLMLVVWGFFMFGGGEDEAAQYIDQATLQSISAPPPEPKPEERTNGLLEALYGLGLKEDLQFVASVDFNREAIIVYSLVPDEGFRKVGDVFQKVVELQIEPVKPKKPFALCYSYLKTYDIISLDRERVEVEIHKQLPVEEVNRLLKNLRGCPVEIRGSVQFADLLHRQVDLSIILKGSG